MNKSILLLATILLFTSAAAVLGQERVPKSAYEIDRWDTITHETIDDCEGDPKVCAITILKRMNIDVGDDVLFSVYRLGETNEKSVTVVFVSEEVNDDDSVSGILYGLFLSLDDVEDRAYHLDFAGRQYKCARGRSGWSKKLCP